MEKKETKRQAPLREKVKHRRRRRKRRKRAKSKASDKRTICLCVPQRRVLIQENDARTRGVGQTNIFCESARAVRTRARPPTRARKRAYKTACVTRQAEKKRERIFANSRNTRDSADCHYIRKRIFSVFISLKKIQLARLIY